MKRSYAKLGGQLGLGCVALGLIFIGLGWNGAAGVDFASGQIPYLLSGGALGLALVVVGVGLIVVQNSRRDRSLLEAQLRELNTSISRLTAALGGGGALNGERQVAAGRPRDAVVLGRSSFHRPECRLVQGKDLPEAAADAAMAQGLSPCRICRPVDEAEAAAAAPAQAAPR